MSKQKQQGTKEDFYVECKARQSLNVTRELAKSIRKSKSQFTALIWKRLVKSDGSRRQPDGVPIVVCLTLDTFIEIVESKIGNSFYDDPFWKQLP